MQEGSSQAFELFLIKNSQLVLLILASLSLIPLTTASLILLYYMAGLEDGVRYCANKENTTLFGKLQSYAFQQLLLVLALILFTIALFVATWLTKQREGFLHKK